MTLGRRSALLSLLAASACAGGGARTGAEAARPPRDPALFPWVQSGLHPTASAIRYTLRRNVYEVGEACPFRILTCADSNRARRQRVIWVENVSCRPAAGWEDRCRFDLIEQYAGRRARSRCAGRFHVVGTSHDPMTWEVRVDDYERPRIRCLPRLWRPPAARARE